jgi:hypothetical protein
MNDEHKDAQQAPTHDSALQTPQPDQAHPPVSDRPSDAPDDSPPVHVEVETDEPVEVTVDNPAAPSEGGQTESD